LFETQKIDSFFSGEKNLLDEDEKIYISRRTKVVRFLKLFLPCLTALLLGLGVALFDFDANNENALTLAEEEKLYFEKFRIKNTVFEITEKDNRLSILKADTVEEAAAGTKVYDLAKPNAQTLDKDKLITISSLKGIYNQTTQVLELIENVVSDYAGQMEIKTSSATYDFANEYGFGNEPISGEGEKGNFKADKFTYDKKKGIVTLIGNVFLSNSSMNLKTPEKAVMYLHENKFTASNAIAVKGENTLKGDMLTAYFKDTKNFEIDKAFSNGHTEIYAGAKKAFADRGEYYANNALIKLFGNVKIIDTSGYTATADKGVYDMTKEVFRLTDNVRVRDKSGYTASAETGIYNLSKKTFELNKDVVITKGTNVITAPKAVYFQIKDEFHFYDNVKVTQDGNTATAQSGVYYIKKNLAELRKNVVISKDGNIVKGDKAVSDFNTSKSRLTASTGGRISGKLIESTFNKKKD